MESDLQSQVEQALLAEDYTTVRGLLRKLPSPYAGGNHSGAPD